MSSQSHTYSSEFYDYINAGSVASARVIAPLIRDILQPRTLLDVGCGAGAWCKVWKEQGIDSVIGVDGGYVDLASLLISSQDFIAQDLSTPFDINARVDLVTSLEVAEHIPAQFADVFVDNLVRHGDHVLFSAAVPGQGGEFHVNEQPPEYWRRKFFERGYQCFDLIRPSIVANANVEPWYRYNTLLYVSGKAVAALPPAVIERQIPQGVDVPNLMPLGWRTRNALIRLMPGLVSERLVELKHAWVRRSSHR